MRYRGTQLPDTTFLKFKFNAHATLVATALAPFPNQIYVGNSIFDPYFYLGGDAPLYFSRWSGFYNKYVVFGSKIRWRLFVLKAGTNPTNDSLVRIYAWPTAEATERADFSGMTERFLENRPDVRRNYIQMTSSLATTSSARGNMYYSTKKAFAEGDLENDMYAGEMGAGSNPISQWYWNFKAFNLGINTDYELYLDVNITYYVKLFDKKTVND